MTKKECPICLCTYAEGGSPFDSPCETNIQSKCKHYLCMECWKEIYNRACQCCIVKCPLCREDITEWLFSNYDSDED